MIELKLISKAIQAGKELRVGEHGSGAGSTDIKYHARVGKGAASYNAVGVTVEEALTRLERFMVQYQTAAEYKRLERPLRPCGCQVAGCTGCGEFP